ncbi:hypothetical protein FACS1894211_05090 [Clostridia bacterium]|nr:hypothetical protein FACS1894211_05090 [Clostridia bacterium]
MKNIIKTFLCGVMATMGALTLMACGSPTTQKPSDNNPIVIEQPSNPSTTVPSNIPTAPQGNAVVGTYTQSVTSTIDFDTLTANNATYGTVAEITANGTYLITGTTAKGFVAITKKSLDVTLILNGASITSDNYASIVCLKKSNVNIILANGSVNYLTSGTSFVQGFDSDENANATLCIRQSLTLAGSGALYVNGAANNGIGSKGDLTISDGTYNILANNNAIKGNDSIEISGGTFYIGSNEDGIKSEIDETDASVGYINITGGSFEIATNNDGIDAGTSLTISNATMKIITRGGYTTKITDSTISAKGLKAETFITIDSGNFNINSQDDGVHSDGFITINNGTFIIATADDGFHAEQTLEISNGTIKISNCYEGLEALNINIKGGNITISATDDGVNISNGSDNSATQNSTGRGGMGGKGGNQGGGETVINGLLNITGGTLTVTAKGDGLDSNGNITMSGGTVIVKGNENVDFNGTFTKTGGTMTAGNKTIANGVYKNNL